MIRLFKLLFRLRTIRGLDENDLLVITVPGVDYLYEEIKRIKQQVNAMELPCKYIIKPKEISLKLLTKWSRIQIPEPPDLTINEVRDGLGLSPVESGDKPYIHHGKRDTPKRLFFGLVNKASAKKYLGVNINNKEAS